LNEAQLDFDPCQGNFSRVHSEEGKDMQKVTTLGLTVVLLASAAFAHQGVKNPAVAARMHGMSEIGRHMKVLGDMAKGVSAFDAAAAQKAAAGVALHASEAPAMFHGQESDPKSEALPAIWDNFADFTAKAEQLEIAAKAAAQGLADPADLGPAMQAMGGACAACHKVYRKIAP